MIVEAALSGLRLVRKDKPIGQTFGSGFSWPEAADAAADVYNGVSESTQT